MIKWLILKWRIDSRASSRLIYHWIRFYIDKASERAYRVQIILPNTQDDYPDNATWLLYDRDFEEWYESIDSAKYAVETYLSNVLWFIFEEDEKDYWRCREKVS